MVDNRYSGIGYEPPFEFADDPQDRAPMTEAIEEYEKLQAERDRLKADNERLKNMYAAHIGDEHDQCGTAINQRLKGENERQRTAYVDLQSKCAQLESDLKACHESKRLYVDKVLRLEGELKLCNRSRKWWKSLAYEANAEKISCRAATIKQNEKDALRRE